MQNALAGGHQLCTQFSIIQGSLAELLCFCRYQIQKLRVLAELLHFDVVKLKTEDVSQNSFVFKFADRQIDG